MAQGFGEIVSVPPTQAEEALMSFTFRTIPVPDSPDWTAQALFDNGTLYVIQTLGTFTDQPGEQGGNAIISAQTLAHYACAGNVGARGGDYQLNNHEAF